MAYTINLSNGNSLLGATGLPDGTIVAHKRSGQGQQRQYSIKMLKEHYNIGGRSTNAVSAGVATRASIVREQDLPIDHEAVAQDSREFESGSFHRTFNPPPPPYPKPTGSRR